MTKNHTAITDSTSLHRDQCLRTLNNKFATACERITSVLSAGTARLKLALEENPARLDGEKLFLGAPFSCTHAFSLLEGSRSKQSSEMRPQVRQDLETIKSHTEIMSCSTWRATLNAKKFGTLQGYIEQSKLRLRRQWPESLPKWRLSSPFGTNVPFVTSRSA